MPELPDVVNYQQSFQRLITGKVLEGVLVRGPSLLRTFEPPLECGQGRRVLAIERLGKRIVWRLEDELFLVFHLMIAGRFHRRKPASTPTRKTDLAAFRFRDVTFMLTEASPKKRASLHLVAGRDALARHDPGGIDVLRCSEADFSERLTQNNRTLKRALTDPRTFEGIGNAYSDEILHAARLSPLKRTAQLDQDETRRLWEATRRVLNHWIERIRREVGDGFPERVTAFREGMAVHGRFNAPCPTCGTSIRRIVHAENEMNYCPRCQTGGKVLRDRSLSRLLKDDWPDSIEDWQ